LERAIFSISTMTTRQEEILLYLYKFRFLTRNQIQSLLGHKHFNRVIVWLNKLTAGGYIRRYYNSRFVTKPAMYSLGLKARAYLKKHPQKGVKILLLDRVWREHKLSKQFYHHCLLVADCYLSLAKLVRTTGAKLHFYTKTDLYGLRYLILPNPDAYFSIEETNGRKKGYFLDIFDDLPVRMVLRKRIRQYFRYFENDYWQDHNENPFPAIILVCPDTRSFNYLYRYTQKLLEEEPELAFYLTARDDVKTKGLIRDILHLVEPQNL
jgi:hypothetical protein